MISGAYTSSEKAGRLFFKRTAVFFWEDSEWGAGLFARTPKGEPVYFSMICSASSSRRRLICHVVSARHPARDVQRENPHKPNTLLLPVFGICSRFGSIQPIRPPGALPCTSSYFSMKRWSTAAISARVAVPCESSRLPDFPFTRPLPTTHCMADGDDPIHIVLLSDKSLLSGAIMTVHKCEMKYYETMGECLHSRVFNPFIKLYHRMRVDDN